MDKHILKANKRTEQGRKVKKLRKEGILPANIYGKKIKSQSIQVQLKDFVEVFKKTGETGLIELAVEEKKLPVLIHNVQLHPLTSLPLHADFFQVDLKEKVTARVPIVTIGEAPAVKDKLGVLLHIISEIEVEALPTDLPEKIEVDVSALSAIDQSLKISQLKLSDKIKVLTETEQEIVKIAPLVSKEAEKMAKEEAEAAASAASEVSQPVEGVQVTETAVSSEKKEEGTPKSPSGDKT